MFMVSTSLLDLDRRPGAPAVWRATAPDPVQWAGGQRAMLRAAVTEHGAVLVRGLGLRDRTQVATVFGRLADGLMTETEAFAPRHRLVGGTYSSTPWPANQPMGMHHEQSYTAEIPGLVLFACLTAPADGGVTALADASAVLEALPPDLTARFEREGWLLTRSYNYEVGPSLADAFGTSSLGGIARYCRTHAIECSWQADGGLRTRQRRPAVVRHPVTGLRCWFNQVAFLSRWTLPADLREYLLAVYGEDGLPFDTRFGGGDPIDEDVVALLNGVYEAHTVREPWQAGDLMLVDNIRTAHSREAYTGAREVVVGMADPVRTTDLATA
jgi:alpha-ketoglutarate-dependent taurine dioxygenase